MSTYKNALQKQQYRLSRSPVLKASMVALVLRISGAGLLFVFNLLIVKLLGISDSGIFFLGMTFINIATVFLLLGIDQFVLRSISSVSDTKQKISSQLLLSRAVHILLASSLVGIAVLILLSGWVGKIISQPSFSTTLSLLSLSLPFLIIASLFGESLRARRLFTQSVFITTNCLYVIVIPLLLLLSQKDIVTLQNVSLMFVVASSLYLAVSLWILRRSTGSDSIGNVFKFAGIKDYTSTIKESRHLLWASVLYLSMGWVDVLIVGFFLPPAQVSIYAIASRVAKLMTFPLFAVNTIIAPRISYFHNTGDASALAKEAQKSTLLSIAFSLPLFMLFILLPGFFMGIFGSDFEQGINVFRILVIGQAINSFTGAVIVIMSMMKLEKKVNYISATGIGFQLLLGVLLTPAYGMVGMAIGTVIGTTILNIGGLLVLLLGHQINIIPGMSLLKSQKRTP